MRSIRVFFVLMPALLLISCAASEESDNQLPVQCVDRPSPGPCTGQLKRFWYDYQSDSCRMFYYGGCGGHVPFATREACEALCLEK